MAFGLISFNNVVLYCSLSFCVYFLSRKSPEGRGHTPHLYFWPFYLWKQYGVVSVGPETWKLRFWLWHQLVTWLCKNHLTALDFKLLFFHEKRGFNYMTSPTAQTTYNDVINGIIRPLEMMGFFRSVQSQANMSLRSWSLVCWVILMERYM